MYRSQEANFTSVKEDLKTLVDLNKTTLIIGDMNYCYIEDHNELSKYLSDEEFHQLVKDATHIKGSVLDHAHFRQVGDGAGVDVDLITTYYSDHDMVTVLISYSRKQKTDKILGGDSNL